MAIAHSLASEKRLSRELRSVDALLDAEGSPLTEPRIHPDVAESLWAEALREKSATAYAIQFSVPAGQAGREAEVRAAVRHHFQQRCGELEEELKNIFADGRRSLVIGLLVVTALIIAAEALIHVDSSRLTYVISESMVILAWVALWHPGDLLLYAHLPVRHRLRVARALARAEVRLV